MHRKSLIIYVHDHDIYLNLSYLITFSRETKANIIDTNAIFVATNSCSCAFVFFLPKLYYVLDQYFSNNYLYHCQKHHITLSPQLHDFNIHGGQWTR